MNKGSDDSDLMILISDGVLINLDATRGAGKYLYFSSSIVYYSKIYKIL